MFGRVEEFSIEGNNTIISLVYPISRVERYKEDSDIDLLRNPLKRIRLGEYLAYDHRVKAMARVYFDWDFPSIAGCPMAIRVIGDRDSNGYTSHSSNWTRDIPLKEFEVIQNQLDGTLYEKYLVSFIIPLGIWENELKSKLIPYLSSLLNPEVDQRGVSKIRSLQLNIGVSGLASYEVKVDRIENTPEYIESVNSLGGRQLDKISYLAKQVFRYDIGSVVFMDICCPSKDADIIYPNYYSSSVHLNSKDIITTLDPSYNYKRGISNIKENDKDKFILNAESPFILKNRIYIPL